MSKYARNGFLSWRRLRNAVGSPGAAAAKLAYSDYFFIAAIVTGIIGSSAFVAGLSGSTINGSTIVGFAVLLGTIFTAVGRYLQSKGD